VSWKDGSDEVHCSCNALVYRGMPCIHIASVALDRNYKIPLQCFNRRYFSLQHSLQLAASLERPPPLMLEDIPDPVVFNPVDEVISHTRAQPRIPFDELHITESFFNSSFADEDSLKIRAEITYLSMLILTQLKPLSDMQQVMGIITNFEKNLEDEINKLAEASQPQIGTIDHPTTVVPYNRVSYKVAQACLDALRRRLQK